VLIEVSTPEGQQSGRYFDSVVNCVNIVTLDRNRVLRKLGGLPGALMQKVHDALKAALELPEPLRNAQGDLITPPPLAAGSRAWFKTRSFRVTRPVGQDSAPDIQYVRSGVLTHGPV
jgi:hypothetical protein